jgi:hypothetical protein
MERGDWMDYDWRPTTNRSATTAGGLAVPRHHENPDVPPDSVPREDVAVTTAVEEFVAAAEAGRARNRNGRRYRPSALRDLAGALRLHVVSELGDMRLRDVQWQDLQGIVDTLAAARLSVSRIGSVVSAIRALYAYAIEQGIVDASPADGLEVPREVPPRSEEAYDDDYGGEGDEAASMWDRAEGWRDAAEEAWTESPFARRGRADRPRADAQPAGLLPEKALSFLLRLLLIAFILIVLLSLAEALLAPA